MSDLVADLLDAMDETFGPGRAATADLISEALDTETRRLFRQVRPHFIDPPDARPHGRWRICYVGGTARHETAYGDSLLEALGEAARHRAVPSTA